MSALTTNRNTQRRAQGSHVDPVAAGVVIHSGALIVLNATSFAQPATVATGLRIRGVAEHASNNVAGGDGAGNVVTRMGSHFLANAGDIDRSHIGSTAYIADDQTVTAVSTGSSAVGRIDDVASGGGVWVFIS
ncbi:hypothetical protein [Neptunomonas antarctica]|uniref:Bacteriophage lambda head decoration protein D n=1 Tax=Neptunomonas antarctica TaxID=619304 RepID=A0A1N7MPT5_9GAMM|nr:hypothetical protein [Neptunomonas antarctica]SIS87951.1 hypothetical protein SAMN05421760_106241 [Neptunomonas antarctica]